MKVTVYPIYDIYLVCCEFELNNILDIQLKVDDNKVCFSLLSASGRSYLYDTSEFTLVVSYG